MGSVALILVAQSNRNFIRLSPLFQGLDERQRNLIRHKVHYLRVQRGAGLLKRWVRSDKRKGFRFPALPRCRADNEGTGK